MLNWIYYKMAMHYLRKSHNVPVMDVDKWIEYMNKSRYWIAKVRL